MSNFTNVTKPTTINDFISKEDFDYIGYFVTPPKDFQGLDDIFAGCFKSINGKIVPLDGDIYSTSENVIKYERFVCPEDDITNGLNILVKGEWYSNRPE